MRTGHASSRAWGKWLGALALAGTLPAIAPAAEKLQFNRDVRPILAENCFACHGRDKAARKAGLRLDDRDEAVAAGAIVPGKPDDSALIERIFADDPGQRMPLAKSGKKLTAAQKEILKRWITEGAAYQPHWAFIPPTRPPLPAVKNTSWVRNPIDAFILAELAKHGLAPAPEADRRTLARRASLDLTGLPPTPEEVEDFVRDGSPDAYEKYVDELLRSPHWGEHRGRYWLDAARYADTHGIHFDNYREMWSYRDAVIRAFNANEPFDRFTVEQLAGDLLPHSTLQQRVASGFNRCNITSNEGGLIPEEYLVLYARDRTETTAQVWLGLTAGCAVCHDHKFDPISQKEFYSLAAFFNNTTQGAMDGNVKDTPPVVFVPRPADRARWDALPRERAAIGRRADERRQAMRADFEKWLKTSHAEELTRTLPADGLRLYAPLGEGEGRSVTVRVNGKVRATLLPAGAAWAGGYVAPRALKARAGATLELPDAGNCDTNEPFSYGAWVKPPARGAFGAVFARMDNTNEYRGWDLWLENGRPGTHIVHRWPEDALKVVARSPLPAGQWSHVFVTYDGSRRAAGVHVYINGVPQPVEVEADQLKGSIRTGVPFKVGQRHTSGRLDGVLVQDVRIYGRSLAAAQVQRLARTTRAAGLLARPADKRHEAENRELLDWYLSTSDRAFGELMARLDELQREEAAIRDRGTEAHVMHERAQMPMAYVLFRGEYDKRRGRVGPDTPRVLPPLPPGLPRNRLGLAQWLLLPEHPLTARVTVNRFWQEVFGTGIVRTSGDFGTAGEPPSHPELLDWLAVEFRESGWDVKKFFRLLVTSATYRQQARTTPQNLEKDPSNRLLSRGPRFRMDAEMVRDYALAASGLLVREVGGPSVKPYQPEGVWEAVAMMESNTRYYRRDDGENLYRRSLYTFWKRAAPPASMDLLNAPSREVCTVRRERTNTPLQALVTLNDPQFVEAARVLAQAALKEGGPTTDTRLDFIARRLVSRPLRQEEVGVVRSSLDDLLAYYKGHRDDARKLIRVGEAKVDTSLEPAALAAWTMLSNELMNLDEVLNK
jgi:hypothetical protein